MAIPLSPYDQRVYDAGYSFIPQSQYLLRPFQIPTTPTSEEPITSTPAPTGIATVYRPQGGGDGQLFNTQNNTDFARNYQNVDFDKMYASNEIENKINNAITNKEAPEVSSKFSEIEGEIPGFNFIDAPTSLKSRIQNPQFLNNPRRGFIDNTLMQSGNPGNSIFDKTKSGINKGIDLAKTLGSGILSAVTGVPFMGPALEGITGALSSQFENRPLGAAVIDEFGNVYDEDELNQMNALGGYYTDAARSARRRTSRIQNMLERQKEGKKISLKNLMELQAQEAAQEAARQAAADRMQAENRAGGTGGYQAGYDSDFMDGPGGGRDAGQEASSPGSSGPGGSDSMGSFAEGGIVDMLVLDLLNKNK